MKLTVRGEIDLGTLRRLEQAREQALVSDPRRILIDLSAVPFVDSSGLKFLLETYALAQQAGWRLELMKPAHTAMRVFAITGADRHLPFIDLEES